MGLGLGLGLGFWGRVRVRGNVRVTPSPTPNPNPDPNPNPNPNQARPTASGTCASSSARFVTTRQWSLSGETPPTGESRAATRHTRTGGLVFGAYYWKVLRARRCVISQTSFFFVWRVAVACVQGHTLSTLRCSVSVTSVLTRCSLGDTHASQALYPCFLVFGVRLYLM